jgi:endonuclease/exonuclease/phosphatase (EEP) superfamily protein YafD
MAACLALAIATHVTVRDRFHFTAIVYYATPLPLIVFGACTLGLVLNRTQSPRWGRAWMLLGFGWKPAAQESPRENAIRLAVWNSYSGNWCTDVALARTIESFDADIVGMVEGFSITRQSLPVWEKRFSQYRILSMDEGLVLMVRGEARLMESESDPERGRVRIVEARVRDTTLRLVLVDVMSSLARPRQIAFERLDSVRQRFDSEPTLILGDFNTPPGSTCFDAWRGEWTNAFERSGTGYSATWPMPLPVLTLDQIWGNRRVEFQSADARWTLASDHRPLVVEFKVTAQSN